MESKKIAAEKAVAYVKDGMTIGLGTGSTAFWAIQLISQRIQQGLQIKAIPTSLETERLARELDIPISTFSHVAQIDLTIDGADEIDKYRNLIKGGGGALLREKIVASNSNQFIVIADETKLVGHLGKFPLPVEVLPFGVELTQKQILKLCNRAQVRKVNEQNYITDNDNFIIDCHFDLIEYPAALDLQLKGIAGVLETGIFLNHKIDTVLIGYKNGIVKTF